MKKVSEYYVVLTDVVASRNIPDRKVFKTVFDRAIQQINIALANELRMPMQGWKGLDEAATLIKNPACLYQLIDTLNTLLAPEQMRVVMVKGAVELPQTTNITQADGPAFHQAASLMSSLKASGLLLAANTGSKQTDLLLQLNINALQLLKSGWTGRQRLLYATYLKEGNQEAVAKSLEVTQQTVSKTLKTINAAQVQQLESDLQQWLNDQLK